MVLVLHCWPLAVAAFLTVVLGAAVPDEKPKVLNVFPDDFFFATSTSAYQIEGAWNEDGKGENIWDHSLHEHPEYVVDRQNGDVACDSYHLYKEDVKLVKQLGVKVYRFSISWARILPNGDSRTINPAGIAYYNNLINELLANGIQPMVTMYHWDLPQFLQNLGGWPNPIIADYFVAYAAVLFENFGDRVKWWSTFNEPWITALGYHQCCLFAPFLNGSDEGFLWTTATIVRSHARAYHLYNEKYRQKQKGRVGISLNCNWMQPVTSSKEDALAAERGLEFWLGVFAHPIFSKEGDWPDVVKDWIWQKTKGQRRARPLLPKFSKEEVKYISGTADFFGLNHYRTNDVSATPNLLELPPGTGVYGNLTEEGGGKVSPQGFRKLLVWIKDHYPGHNIVVTENGFPDKGQLEDDERIDYHLSYMAAMLEAIHVDKSPVIAYTAWSLMDNLEWTQGYTQKFGLYKVDFNDTRRTRTAKKSVRVLSEIFRTRKLPSVHFIS